MSRRWYTNAVLLALVGTTVSCGETSNKSSPTTVVAGEFCEAMQQIVALLSPTNESSPAKTKATFESAAVWFEQANRTAPDSIASDFAVFTAAHDEYAHFLSTVGYNLDVVFSTPEGKQLAIDTSHSLTQSIVQYAIKECGISFGDESREPPTT